MSNTEVTMYESGRVNWVSFAMLLTARIEDLHTHLCSLSKKYQIESWEIYGPPALLWVQFFSPSSQLCHVSRAGLMGSNPPTLQLRPVRVNFFWDKGTWNLFGQLTMLLRQNCSHLYSTFTMIGFVGSVFLSRDELEAKSWGCFLFPGELSLCQLKKGM